MLAFLAKQFSESNSDAMPEKKGPRPDRFLWEEGNLQHSQCFYCRHKQRGPVCASFPGGIPWEILDNQYDHTEPHPDDNGLRFERREDLKGEMRLY